MTWFLLFLLFPVAFGIFALASAGLARRGIEKHGTRVQADVDEVVTVLVPGGPARDAIPAYYVRYRYRDTSGMEHHAKSRMLLEDPNMDITAGKSTVAYDPRHPDRSVWLGR